jgi:hypothetical protein
MQKFKLIGAGATALSLVLGAMISIASAQQSGSPPENPPTGMMGNQSGGMMGNGGGMMGNGGMMQMMTQMNRMMENCNRMMEGMMQTPPTAPAAPSKPAPEQKG